MNPARVYAVALNSFREAVRDRVLLVVLGFASAVLLLTLALAELSLDQQMRVVTDLGMASISLFAVLVAIFLGSSLLYKEIERKTLYMILPKPIRRHEFLLGKYFGIVITCVVFVLTMGAIQFWVTAFQADVAMPRMVATPIVLLALLGLAMWRAHDKTIVLLPWSLIALAASAWLCAGSEDIELQRLIASLLLTIGEVLILTAVALLFSSFSTPFLTGVFTFGVWIVGRSADDMVTMKSRAISDEVRTFLAWLAEVIPNFNLFVPGRNALINPSESFGGPWTYVGTSFAYAVAYSIVVLFIAAMIFRRRDFL